MSSTQAAVVLGASGSVGKALIRELIRNGSFKPIVTLVRRSQPDQVAMARDAGVELRETLVPAMDPAGLETTTMEAIRSLEGDVVGLCWAWGPAPRNSRSTIIARSTCN
jgi:NAD(P)-dependent dehydrogenase (short-subunit alcohol dehydrogenase family)